MNCKIVWVDYQNFEAIGIGVHQHGKLCVIRGEGVRHYVIRMREARYVPLVFVEKWSRSG